MGRTHRKSLSLLAVLAISIAGSQVVIAAEDPTLEAVRAKMNLMFDEIQPQHINRSPIDGWYTVQKGSIVAYVSEDGRYLLQGDMIDLDLQVNLSEQARTLSRRELMSSVGDDQAITFSPAKVKHRVTVFTDVDCTYCRKLHSQIDEYLAHGIEVRYLLYPRNGPASSSWNTSEDVFCARDQNQALTAAKLSRGFETQKCSSSAVTDNYSLGRDVGVSGTPAIKGDMIDLDLQVNLSEQARTLSRRELMSSVGDDQAITFSPAKVKHRVTVFTDVDCTYCRKLHSQIDEYLAHGIEVRYLLYPRNGPASSSWNTSEDVFCARDQNQALTAAKLSRGFETQKCNSSAVTDNYSLGRDVGVSGTPAIIFDDGTLLSGYLPPEALSLRLQQQAAAN